LAGGLSVTSLNLNYFDELNRRHIICNERSINVHDEAEIVRSLSDVLYDKSQFKKTFILGGILVGEYLTLLRI
jgi:hypothetical protein